MLIEIQLETVSLKTPGEFEMSKIIQYFIKTNWERVMKLKKSGPSLVLLALIAVVAACGKDGKGPGNPDAYQGKDGSSKIFMG